MSETTEPNYLWPAEDLAGALERARTHPVEGPWRLYAILRGPHEVHLGGFSADGTRDEMIEKALSFEPTDEDMRLEYREGLRLAADAGVIFQVTVMPKPPWKNDLAKRRFVIQSRAVDVRVLDHVVPRKAKPGPTHRYENFETGQVWTQGPDVGRKAVEDVLSRFGFRVDLLDDGGWSRWEILAMDGTYAFSIPEDALPKDDLQLAIRIVLAIKRTWEEGLRRMAA